MKLLASFLFTAIVAVSSPAAFAAETAVDAASSVAVLESGTAPDFVKGQASFAAICAACHGADGNSVIALQPNLAQQHPEYLIKQLQEFKSSKRANPIMLGFSSLLSEDDMKNISFWVATQKIGEGSSQNPELRALGEKIYRGGVPDRQIASCASCHSPNGAGMPIQYPRLAGQRADYTEQQLKLFRDGSRNNSLQMSLVSAKLNDKEIKALADYIAGLR